MEKIVAIFFVFLISLFFFSVPLWWVRLTGSTRLWYPAVKEFRKLFFKNPKLVYGIPSFLLVLSWLAAASNHAIDHKLLLAAIAYLFMPTLLIVSTGHSGYFYKPAWSDLVVILMLWLPIEYGAWSGFLKNHFAKLAYILPWGAGVVLALFLFSTFRGMRGMKICLPTEIKDITGIAVGFMIAAASLIPVGQAIGFIPDFLVSSGITFAIVIKRFVVIWLGVALPEEVLFRSLIQNWLTQKFGNSNMVLLPAAIIFGLSHLNNGPQTLPNWRYATIATVAGFIYGKVFQKTTSVCSSATLHAAVNTVKHFCFSGGKL